MCCAPQRRACFRHLNFQKRSERLVFQHFAFKICFAPQPRALFRHLNFQKWFKHVVFLAPTARSTPILKCFYHFDIEMCFAPQPRALLAHRKFQRCPDAEVFLQFLLWNVFRAAAACAFPTFQLPNMVWDRCFLAFWLRHVLRATVARNFKFLIRPRRFSEPTFRPSGAAKHWKNTVSRRG